MFDELEAWAKYQRKLRSPVGFGIAIGTDRTEVIPPSMS